MYRSTTPLGSWNAHLAIYFLYLLVGYGTASRVFDSGGSAFAGAASSGGWFKRKLTPKAFFQDMQPVPSRGTCRLSWYTASAPQYAGNTVLCNGSSDQNCREPCKAGYDQLQNSSLCMQRCPDKEKGPAHLCPVSRSCIRAAGVCPIAVEVPYLCPLPDQCMRTCAKQSYQAVMSSSHPHQPCSGTVFKDYMGNWQCAEGITEEPCSPSFRNVTPVTLGVGARCMQECPLWLVDCGDTCNMPGVPCSEKAEALCPVVSLTTPCDLNERSRAALEQACHAEGFRGGVGCPMTLAMHGSCGGSKLQVHSELRNGGFVRAVEAWWGPTVGGQSLPDNFDGPLRAVKLIFSEKSEPVVFGNATHAFSSSPRMTFRMNSNELVVSTNMWSSSTVMDGHRLTPVLAGFRLFTSDRSSCTAGGTTNWAKSGIYNDKVGNALSNWEQNLHLSQKDLGVGLPVGAAAYVSDEGIHSFGFMYISRALKQEL